MQSIPKFVLKQYYGVFIPHFLLLDYSMSDYNE